MSPARIAVALTCLVLCAAAPAVQEAPPQTPQAKKETKEISNDAYWAEVHSGKKVPEFHFVVSAQQWKTMHPEPRRDRRPRSRGPRDRDSGERGPRDRDSGERGPRDAEPGERGGSPRRSRPRPPGGMMGPGTKYTYVKATMIVDGERFNGVGLRFKGNSSFRFAGDRPRKPFKVDTNRFTEALRFRGRTKLNFSNSFKDPTYLKEKVGYEVYREAGLPTPGVGWVRIYLTIEGELENEPLGLYVLVEQVDDDFIETRLGGASKDSLLMKPEGVRDLEYLGDDPGRYDERYDIKEGKENRKLLLRFAELLRLIESGSDEEFSRRIGERVDLENVAGYLAATALLTSLDSFVATPHNYYLLVDAADGKLKVLPWDVNEAFATFTLGRTPESLMRWNIERPWTTRRRLLERLFELEGFRASYLSKVRTLLSTSFTRQKLFARLDKLRDVVEPHLANDAYGEGVDGLVRGLEGKRELDAKRGLDADKGPPRRPREESRPDQRRRRPRGRSIAVKTFIEGRIDSVRRQLAGEEKGENLERRRRGFRQEQRRPEQRRPEQRRPQRDD